MDENNELTFDPEGQLKPTEGRTLLLESMTLDEFRAWRQVGGTVILSGHGYEIRLEGTVWLPDLKEAIDALLVRLMAHEIRLFEE